MKKLFFALISLLLFATNVFADCTDYLLNGEHTLGSPGIVWEDQDVEYELPRPVKSVNFEAKKNSSLGGGPITIEQKIGNNYEKVGSVEPGTKYSNYSITNISSNATFIRFTNATGGSLKKTIKDVKITYLPIINIPTATINFVNGAGTRTIDIEYSALTSNLTASLEKQDGVISLGVPTGTSISSVNIASAGCSYGKVPLTISYNPTNCKDYTNKIIFSNGSTIEINGTYERSFAIDTEDIKFPIVELGADAEKVDRNVSYSYNLENVTATLENADTPFSLSSEILAETCAKGNKTLTITFDPKKVGPYTNVIKLSNGSSINISGECSKMINTKLEVLKESYTSVSLGWTKVDEATAYRIIENTTGVSYIVEGNVTSYNFRGLQTNTSYSFTLYALFDGVASLNSSQIVTAKTLKTDAPIQDCIVYENAEVKWFMASTEENITYDLKTGNSESLAYTKRVEFEAKMEDATIFDATVSLGKDMMLLVKLEGENEFKESGWNAHNAGITEEYQKFTAEIPYNTVAIRFYTGLANGGCWRDVKNLKVYKDRKLETKTAELNFGEVEPNVSISKTFDIDYIHAVLASDVTYDNGKRVVVEDGLGHYKVEYEAKDPCDEGKQTIKVTFTPTNCTTDYNATLTLLNGETVEVKLKGTLKRNPGTVSEITWSGAEDTNWDNRNNWVKEDGTVLSAADVLSENLVVTLPAGKDKYPTLPDVSTEENFKTVRDNACKCSQVNAGDNTTATEIAHKIIMESGAALVGVETLNSGNTPRYTEVQMYFTPERYSQSTGYYEWSLVGPVVKPWDEENSGKTRDVVSGDYYKNDLPHVYMHEAVMTKDGEDYIQTWDNSFASLTVNIPHNKAFAIRMPNQYGRNSSGYGIPASIYNKRNNTSYEAKENITFTFTGRFYNEAGLPEYTGLTPEVPVLLNNTYPANIDADMLQSKGYGTIQCYEGHSFVDVTGRTDAVISSGYGFIFTPNVAEFTIPSDCFQTTKVINNRNAEAEVPSLRLQLKNEDVDGVYSTISISHDELKDDAADYAVDAPKLFNDMESNLADLYVMRYDSKWAGLSVPTVEESLPLGIKVRTANQKYRFNLLNSNLDYDIILEDRQEGKEYNLSAGEVCEVSNLAVGDCRGRFYLKTSESSDDDDEVTTDILDNEKSASIDIYAQGNSVVVSSTNNVNIKKIVVSDLSARQMNYNVSGQYIVLDLPVSSGIYTINVMGDTANRIEKIKLN